MEAWNQGTEEGHVVAGLLFGVVNPSGKVPTSYPRSEADTLYAGRPERHPGTDEGDGYPVIRYSEGLQSGTAGSRPKVQVYLGVPVEGQPPKRLVGSRRCSWSRGSRSR
jgi:Glycosyl hydrolase family 3 C-terminal domain